MPSVDPITAIANAISGIAGMAQPFIEEHFSQLFEKQHAERIKELEGILAEENINVRADLLHEFTIRLLNESGKTITGAVSRNIRIPLDVYIALLEEVSEGIKKDKIINKIQFK